jgi:hypothetical protein
MEESFVDWPFGEADVFTPTVAANIAQAVKKRNSIINLGTLDQNVTLNLTLHPELKKGALLTLVAKSDETARGVTLGTGFLGPAMAGTINKTKSMPFVFDGSKFVATSVATTLD